MRPVFASPKTSGMLVQQDTCHAESRPSPQRSRVPTLSVSDLEHSGSLPITNIDHRRRKKKVRFFTAVAAIEADDFSVEEMRC